MEYNLDESSHHIFLAKFKIKKYKEEILQEIIAAICAMLNSNGGKVKIQFDADGSNPGEGIPLSQISSVIKTLEQEMTCIIGLHKSVSKLHFREDKAEGITISVKDADCFITTNYNLYLPSEKQVVELPPLEPIETVRTIICRNVIPDSVQLGSHCQIFRKDKKCDFQESKIVQFKNLKAEQSRRTTLADRMTNKGNKFSCYVSAFANHRGGHIYYGVKDDGVVEGEFLRFEKDENEITMKVTKCINKMIWPEQIGQPKRGEHWEIFFEPVLDENSKPVPSTFVIVIYIAPCLGGVFTEKPECYEMVERKVMKMSFVAWEKKMFGSDEVESVPKEIARSLTWTSRMTKKVCFKAFFELTLCLNNGDLEGFEKAKQIEKKFPHIVELKLMVLLKDILACSRQHDFETAKRLLKEYNKNLPNVSEHHIFKVLGLYVEAAYNRAKGNEGNALNLIRDLLVMAVALSEWLKPGLVTSLVYLFAGTMTDRFDNTSLPPPNELSNKALKHLQQVPTNNSDVHADLRHKAHITSATFHLGCNLSGELIDECVNRECVDQAKSSILAIEQSSTRQNSELTYYRAVQLNLVKSIYCFRRSQNHPEEKEHFVQDAMKYSKNAEDLARKCNFHEMVSWSKTMKSLLLKE